MSGAPAGVDTDAARAAVAAAETEPDLERRFGGLRRLYGDIGYARVRAGRVAVVGLGGVGSWTAEALARSGVARVVLIDLDHVAESNINRQVQALSSTLGQAKTEALRERIEQIHPGCEVLNVEDFVTESNWPALLPAPVDLVIDACDQVRAKGALALWGLARGVPVVSVGVAGGRERPECVELADLGAVTHDPLLAALRQRLRQTLRRTGQSVPVGRWGLRCVFSRESIARPGALACATGSDEDPVDTVEAARMTGQGVEGSLDASGAPPAPFVPGLNCAGYGSSVMVTACFGFVAAAEAVAVLRAGPGTAADAGPGEPHPATRRAPLKGRADATT
jgi:tRNA threonylcarbamoyladenosine dehydratase